MITASNLIQMTRKLTNDTEVPFDIVDEFIYDFLNEAQKEMAVVGRFFREAKLYEILENDRFIALGISPHILEFRKAELIDPTSGARYSLRLQGTLGQTGQSRTRDYGATTTGIDRVQPGRPNTLIFGKEANSFELFPPANKAYTIEASVITYPPTDFIEPTDVALVPDKYERYLMYGAAMRAMEISDFYNINEAKYQMVSTAWQKILARVAAETGAISRDAGPVHFDNDFWNY